MQRRPGPTGAAQVAGTVAVRGLQVVSLAQGGPPDGSQGRQRGMGVGACPKRLEVGATARTAAAGARAVMATAAAVSAAGVSAAATTAAKVAAAAAAATAAAATASSACRSRQPMAQAGARVSQTGDKTQA